MYELETMVVTSTNWFKSCLSEKSQTVKIGDSFRLHDYYIWSPAGKHPGFITIFMLCE